MSELSQMSMVELFRLEVQNQAQVFTKGLLALERDPVAAEALQACMRAAHSLKGAARIIGLGSGVAIAHAMEEVLVAGQQRKPVLARLRVDGLLKGVDLLERMAGLQEHELVPWSQPDHAPAADYVRFLQALPETDDAAPGGPAPAAAAPPPAEAPEVPEAGERVLRLAAENVQRLLGLASESLVESRGLKPFAEGMQRTRRLQQSATQSLDSLRQTLGPLAQTPQTQAALQALRQQMAGLQQGIEQQLLDLDTLDRRASDLSRRLYDEALACRMRPLADGLHAYPRQVRDLARVLGKEARLDIVGDATTVDRDLLERLDAPLGHLLRNAVDHGIESSTRRRQAGKSGEGVVRLEAWHSGGLLQISIADDGEGVDLQALRSAIVARALAAPETAARMSDAELLEFLFLPGFSLRQQVTEISGRGVGLDVVQDMVRQVRGSVRISSEPGKGTRFQLQLPLTLSVIRALLVRIGGETYALPLARVLRALRLPQQDIEQIEGRQHFAMGERRIGLVDAHQALESEAATLPEGDLAVVVLGDQMQAHGLVVERFLGERELVVQPLDPRLGKLQDVTAGALDDDGSIVLILDTDDLLRAVEKLAGTGALVRIRQPQDASRALAAKRVLIVDDSLTVRELQRKLLDLRGYEVEVAVDGMDGWNALRTGRFDLLVTDVDMPRLDGIELVRMVRGDPRLKSLPVMIVSYKDREADRQRGLDAGADYYLAKGSFHDDALVGAVVDLIGEANA